MDWISFFAGMSAMFLLSVAGFLLFIWTIKPDKKRAKDSWDESMRIQHSNNQILKNIYFELKESKTK